MPSSAAMKLLPRMNPVDQVLLAAWTVMTAMLFDFSLAATACNLTLWNEIEDASGNGCVCLVFLCVVRKNRLLVRRIRPLNKIRHHTSFKM